MMFVSNLNRECVVMVDAVLQNVEVSAQWSTVNESYSQDKSHLKDEGFITPHLILEKVRQVNY